MGEVKRCSLGVGCEDFGVCYASAHGSPDECGLPPPDYDTLRAEVKRLREYKESMAAAVEEDKPEWAKLREIERTARAVLSSYETRPDGRPGHFEWRELAEACGRKG